MDVQQTSTTHTAEDRKKAIRLIEYLKHIATLRSKTVRDTSEYERVLWIKDIPQERGCYTRAWDTDAESESDIWVEVQTYREPVKPSPPPKCEGQYDPHTIKNTNQIPELIYDFNDQLRLIHNQQQALIPHEIETDWEDYIENKWKPWQKEHKRWQSVHKVYSALFEIHQYQAKLGEEYELVLGLGLLVWQSQAGLKIKRHIIVADAMLEFEAHQSKFVVRANTDGPKLRSELDMLEDQPRGAVKEAKEKLNDDPWDKKNIEEVLKSLIHQISPDGEYDDSLAIEVRRSTENPIVFYSPALILRKRSVKGLTDTLNKIQIDIESDIEIPIGFADITETKKNNWNSTNPESEQNTCTHQEVFFPKASNQEQLKIVDKLNSTYGVIVQGPPGTGKSHTIANLICHLLATGQRILVTAKTPRALKVLENHLHEELRPLCINLLGSGLEEKKSLEKSVGGILRKYEGWSSENEQLKINQVQTELENLRQEKAKLDLRLRQIREAEIIPQVIASGAYRGTAARIAERVNKEKESVAWFEDKVNDFNDPCPVTIEVFESLRDSFQNISTEMRMEFEQLNIDPDNLLPPKEFSNLITEEARARDDYELKSKTFFKWGVNTAKNKMQEIEDRILEKEIPLRQSALQENSHKLLTDLLQSFRKRNIDQYTRQYSLILKLFQNKSNYQRIKQIHEKFEKYFPKLTNKLQSEFNESYWDEIIPKIVDAWSWSQAKYWLNEYLNKDDLPALTQKSKQIEVRIKECIAKLSSSYAWSICFERLNDSHRRHMVAWQQSINMLGQSTGRHAPRHRRAAQEHLNQCREAVPAWIMPLHRVWDTIKPSPKMFDVVIIDEASQCGLESLPLFYLSKKILIVGDDKQISPDAVGLNQDKVNQLMNEFLFDYNFQSSFDIQTSLFDQGKLRFDKHRVTLREHFRCMPEIIRFSNNLCYSETPLIPLRQYGPNRLEPLEIFYIESGHCEGSQSRVINPPEADSIVRKIHELCNDNRYAEKTIGVVVLQGEAQASLIESQLLDVIGPEEFEKRRIVCGNSYSFQGDERDVMILSLVTAPNRRIGPFTKASDERRFNVAASRAKDSMILFHSVTLNDLSPSCLRYKLLEFFQNRDTTQIEGINQEELERRAHQDNRRIVSPPPPFDSWFEVDVALELLRKGYELRSQLEVAMKRIDLVVEGGERRLAIECDGDHWHGADQYEKDMDRQRILERCGWEFFRIRESEFYIDKSSVIKKLIRILDERGIYPKRRYFHHDETADNFTDKEEQSSVYNEEDEQPEETIHTDYNDEVGTIHEYSETAEIKSYILSDEESLDEYSEEASCPPEYHDDSIDKIINHFNDSNTARFPFTINRSFIDQPSHPITIKKSIRQRLRDLGVFDSLTHPTNHVNIQIINLYNSVYDGKIYYGISGGGYPYYQITVINQNNDSFCNGLQIGQNVQVVIGKTDNQIYAILKRDKQ